jgi:hypothetical protein
MTSSQAVSGRSRRSFNAMTALPDRMTLVEFLSWEQEQSDRWKFADGYASPMAGAMMRTDRSC